MVGRNGDRSWEVASFAPAAGGDEGLLLRLAVQYYVPVADAEPVPRTGHDALDEVDLGLVGRGLVAGLAVGRRAATAHVVLLGPLRRVEDDDVADVGIAQP